MSTFRFVFFTFIFIEIFDLPEHNSYLDIFLFRFTIFEISVIAYI